MMATGLFINKVNAKPFDEEDFFDACKMLGGQLVPGEAYGEELGYYVCKAGNYLLKYNGALGVMTEVSESGKRLLSSSDLHNAAVFVSADGITVFHGSGLNKTKISR